MPDGGQKRRGLRRGNRQKHCVEAAGDLAALGDDGPGLHVGSVEMPHGPDRVAPVQIGDVAGHVERRAGGGQPFRKGAGQGGHARRSNPTRLAGPSGGGPGRDDIFGLQFRKQRLKPRIPRRGVLRAVIERDAVHPSRRDPTARTASLVEQSDLGAAFAQGGGAGKSGHAGPNDGD
jgi:hypothetical protein